MQEVWRSLGGIGINLRLMGKGGNLDFSSC